MAIPMLKIRRPNGRLIFNMGIAIPSKTVFLIETAPGSSYSRQPNYIPMIMMDTLSHLHTFNENRLTYGNVKELVIFKRIDICNWSMETVIVKYVERILLNNSMTCLAVLDGVNLFYGVRMIIIKCSLYIADPNNSYFHIVRRSYKQIKLHTYIPT